MKERKNIGTLLVEYGLISSADLEKGLKEHEETGLRLGESLVKLGKLVQEDIEWVLSKQLDIPFVIIEDVDANADLIRKFKKDFLIENRVLPLHETDDEISVVIDDPLKSSALEVIETTLNKKVNISTGSGRKIESFLLKHFKKEGIPDLIDTIKGIIERIKETSFYRIDFHMDEDVCSINVFGSTILKEIEVIKASYIKDDIFRAFDSLGIPFLFDYFKNSDREFIAVYPLMNSSNGIQFPSVISKFGLYLPREAAFCDAEVHGLSHIIRTDHPVRGYPFIAIRKSHALYDKTIFTHDTVPENSSNLNVSGFIPHTCGKCKGKGCRTCNNLGYEFRTIEGTHSSKDLNSLILEDTDGTD